MQIVVVSYIDGTSVLIDDEPAPLEDGFETPTAQEHAHFIHSCPLLAVGTVVVLDKLLAIVLAVRAHLIKYHRYYLVHIVHLLPGRPGFLFPEDPWLQIPENQ